MEQLKMTMTTWADRKIIVKNYPDDDDVNIEIVDERQQRTMVTYLTHAQVRDLIKFLQEIENNS